MVVWAKNQQKSLSSIESSHLFQCGNVSTCVDACSQFEVRKKSRQREGNMEAADSRKLEQRKAELEEKEKESLQVIKEDLSKWLRRLLESDITAGEFLAHLDTGVLLCKLAHRIQQAARQQPKKTKIPLNDVRLNVFARKESFHARDNAANFIKWCRGMDVEESVMFESDGLVLHKDERRVVLCILEVARIAGELGLDIPKLIELEREIDKLEEGKKSGGTEVPSNEEVKSEGPPRPKRRRQETLDDKVEGTNLNTGQCPQ